MTTEVSYKYVGTMLLVNLLNTKFSNKSLTILLLHFYGQN